MPRTEKGRKWEGMGEEWFRRDKKGGTWGEREEREGEGSEKRREDK